MSDFSSNLRRLRKQANLSQDVLAERLSVSRQTVSSWERSNSYPDLDMLVRISAALETDPNALLYPGEKRVSTRAERLAGGDLFGHLAIIVFTVGFLLGLRAGSQLDLNSINSASWHFVFSDALRCWTAAFLIGMVFVGFQQILARLDKGREDN